MRNKLLIKLYIPAIDCEYEIFIPANETIKKVVDLLVNCVVELSDVALPEGESYYLFDPDTATIYPYSAIIRDTNIINDKKLILL